MKLTHPSNIEPRPLVSVVTTCYAHAPFLPDYFESLLNQTYRNIELIFLDDGSPDDSWDVAKKYEARLQNRLAKVVMLRQSNQGMHAAVSRVVGEATGDFICILESDDYYLPCKIERNIDYFSRHPNVGVVHSDVNYIYGDGVDECHWRARGVEMPTGMAFDSLLADCFVTTCSMCFRREAFVKHVRLGEYANRGYLAADYPGCLDLSRHVEFGYIDEALACYRILEESATHSRDVIKVLHFYGSTMQIRRDFLREYGPVGKELSERIRSDYLGFAYWAREAGLYRDSLDAYLSAIRQWGLRRDIAFHIAKLIYCRLARRGNAKSEDLAWLLPKRCGVKRPIALRSDSTHDAVGRKGAGLAAGTK